MDDYDWSNALAYSQPHKYPHDAMLELLEEVKDKYDSGEL
jgi:hypothetical protein